MRKEYNDRWNAPLVNPGFTLPEYEAQRTKDAVQAEKAVSKNADRFYSADKAYFDAIKARSEA